MFKIYTDGSCNNWYKGCGGYCSIIIDEHSEVNVLTGQEKNTTSNRCEMLAVITALASLPARSSVTVITDSEYVKRGITEWIHTWEKSGWKTSEGKPVKNLDLWLLMKNVVKAHHVEFKWTPGHSGVWGNESADFIAKLMAKNLKKQAELAIARAKLYQDVKKYVASR